MIPKLPARGGASETGAHRWPHNLRPHHLPWLAGGVAWAASAVLSGASNGGPFFAAGLTVAPLAALVVGIRRHRPPDPLPWGLLACGTALFAFAAMVRMLDMRAPGVARWGEVVEAGTVASGTIVLGALVLLIRRAAGDSRWVTLIDAAILLAGLSAFALVLLGGRQTAPGSGATEDVVTGPLVLAAASFAVIARMSAGEGKGPAHGALVIAVAGLLLAELSRAGASGPALREPGYVIGLFLSVAGICSAALHPSMRRIGGKDALLAADWRWVPVTALVLAPLVLAVQVVRRELEHSMVLVVLCTGLLVLAALRFAADPVRARGGPWARATTSRLPRQVVPIVLLTLLSLGFLVAAGTGEATAELEAEVERRVRGAAEANAAAIRQEMLGVGAVVEAYGRRPAMQAAVASSDSRQLLVHLQELVAADPRIGSALVAAPDGSVVGSEPPLRDVQPSGRHREWYRIVKAGRSPLVTAAFVTTDEAAGVVAVAAAVPSGAGRPPAGILIATYKLGSMQRFVEGHSSSHGVLLRVTDQRGTTVATPPGGSDERLETVAHELGVRRALLGQRTVEWMEPAGDLRASVPVEELGWTVSVTLPGRVAASPVTRFRQVAVAGVSVLALVVIGGLLLLSRVLAQLNVERLHSDAVMRSVASGITLTDPGGLILGVNPAMERLSGWSEEEIRGRPQTEVFMLDGESPGGPSQADATSSSRATLRRRDGSEVPVAIASAPVRGPNGAILGAVTVVRDRSDEHEVEEIRRSLISAVSHELRTPLTMIKGFSELLLSRPHDERDVREGLQRIEESADRLGRLVDELLAASRLESGTLEPSLEAVLLQPLFREALGRHPGARGRVLLDADPELAVLADRAMLGQIVASLLSHALERSADRVHVAAQEAGEVVRLAVTDRGPELRPEELLQVFDRFFRSSRHGAAGGGMGFALYVSKRLVQLQGGEIWADSRPGHGTTISVTLPRADLHRPSAAEVGWVPDLGSS